MLFLSLNILRFNVKTHLFRHRERARKGMTESRLQKRDMFVCSRYYKISSVMFCMLCEYVCLVFATKKKTGFPKKVGK